jgi:hypothetical protein
MNIRKLSTFLALIVCGFLSSAPQAKADVCSALVFGHPNLVNNCGFETGSFSSWTVGGNTANPGGNYYGVDSFDANSGNYGAYVSQDFVDGGKAPVTLSQTLSTTPGSDYVVSFWVEQDTKPTTGYNHAFSAVFGGTTMLTLSPTVTAPGTVGSFVEYSFEEMATSPTTTVQFSFENDENYWSFDDVSVALAPEPSTIFSAGAALAALLLLRSRRSVAN